VLTHSHRKSTSGRHQSTCAGGASGQIGTNGTIAAALSDASIDPAAFVERFVAPCATRLNASTLAKEEAVARLATARARAAGRINQSFIAHGPASGQGRMGGRAPRW
jgi:hypothetical protein